MNRDETQDRPPGREGERSPERERIVDELLVLRAQEGSRDAFELLVTRWQERLWRHAYRLTGDENEAWDVMQESWMGVTRGIRRLRDAGAFRRWAYTIVTRAATDRLRKRGPEEPTPPEAFDDRALDEGEGDERAQAIGALRAALGRLSAEERTLLSLRYLEGFELWELAEVLGIPEGTVKSRLHHARRRLKDVFERTER